MATKTRQRPAAETVPGISPGTPDLGNLDACIADAKQAAMDSDPGPPEPTNFHQLRGRLEAARAKFPPLYQQTVVDPYIRKLDELGRDSFTEILLQDPRRTGAGGLMMDIAQVILQKGEGYEERSIDAFQQVVSDLYDGFLSAEDRKAVQPPENATTPPLVKFGNPQEGPYTWPVDATRAFDVQAAVVNLPPAQSRQGILGWAALGHETGGHDILHAYAGLQDQLATAVRSALQAANLNNGLADYWANRIDETSADVLGIMNMGPAAAIGIIGYFRGLNAAFRGVAKLRSTGPADDLHPADIVRGYLGAAVVGRLSFARAAVWEELLKEQTDQDAETIVLAGTTVSRADAQKSADIVAETIMRGRTASLEDHALGEIQDWRDGDEELVRLVRRLLTTAGDFPLDHVPRIYAAHVVAGAVLEALAARDEALPPLFDRMKAILGQMHAANPSWSRLFVRHPGSLVRDFAYSRRSFAPAMAEESVVGVRVEP